MERYWTRVDLYNEADDYFDAILSSIELATQKIDIESYIFDIDPLTFKILDLLRQAVSRGVEVRLLVDGAGSYQSIDQLTTLCKAYGIQLRIYQPLVVRKILQKFFTLKIPRIFQLIRRLNRRNHRKLVLVDNQIAFLGSINFSRLSSKKYSPLTNWRESALRVEGSGVSDLVRSNKMLWHRSRRGLIPRFLRGSLKDKSYQASKSWVRINTSFRARLWEYRNLLNQIKNSKKEILIETAYFLPKRSLIRELSKAAARGVNVKIIIPGPSDVPMVKWAAYGIVQKMTKNNVQFFEYQPSILHAKFIIIDEWALIGSTNLNYRSLHHDLEIEAILKDEKTLSKLKERWHQDCLNSLPLTYNVLSKISWYQRLLFWTAFKLRYFL